MFMPLLCKSCGFWKMLDIFGPSWLVACEVRTVPLILVNEFMLNFALTLFGFTVIRCITVISCSRMCSLGSLPLVLEALWHLDENQLCKPFGMLYILHWDVHERDRCISKCRFPSLTSNLSPDELWWKNIALHCIVYIWLDTLFWKNITNEQYFGEKVPVAQNMIGMFQYEPIACSLNDFLFNRNKIN